jgi:hypothetical protein
MKRYFLLLSLIAVSLLTFSQTPNAIVITTREGVILINDKGQTLKGPYLVQRSNSDYIQVRNGKANQLLDPYTLELLFDAGEDSIVSADTGWEWHITLLVNGKEGVYKRDKSCILPPLYEDVWILEDQETGAFVFSAKKDTAYGVIDRTGNVIVPFELDEHISTSYSEFYMPKKKGKYALADSSFKLLTPFKYDRIDYFSNGVCRVEIGGKNTYIDKKGKELLALTAKNLEALNSQLFSIKVGDKGYYGQHGVLNTAGKMIVPGLYDYVGLEGKGIVVRLEQKLGYYNKQGVLVLPAAYDNIKLSGDSSFLRVELKEKTGAYSFAGKALTPIKYSTFGEFEQGLAEVSADGKYGLLNKKWKEIVPLIYEDLDLIDSTCYIFKKNGRYGLNYLGEGKTGISPVYDKMEYQNESGLLLVSIGGKWGLLDLKGTAVLECVYDEIRPLWSIEPYVYPDTDTIPQETSYDLIRDGKHGYADSRGTIMFPAEYDEQLRFFRGRAVAIKNGHSCFVGEKNTVLFPKDQNTCEIRYFYQHVLVRRNDKYNLIDRQGNLVPESTCDTMYTSGKGCILLRNKNTYTLLDSLDQVLVRNCKYRVSSFSNGIGVCNSYGTLLALVNKEGNLIMENNETTFGAQNAGYVSSEICDLKNLEELYFEGNDWDYNFDLPECFYDLPKVKKLVIRNSDYPGVPDDIGKLKQLHYLEIISQKFGYISPELGKLPLLDTLILYDTCALPSTFSSCRSLKYLSVRNNKLPALPSLASLTITSDTLPAAIKEFRSLKKLHMLVGVGYYSSETYDDSTRQATTERVYMALKDIPSLEEINISGSYSTFNYNMAQTFIAHPEYLSGLPALKKVHIGEISEEDREPLQKAFPGIEFVK